MIATLPAVHRNELLERIIGHPAVDGVRYNTGICSAYPPRETLERILELTVRHNKKFWIDLKGRQLRIVQWAVPNYGKIILNHDVEVECPAKVFFRGNDYSELKFVRGREIYVDPPPRYAVGAGQAINIHGKNLKIKGYLTEEDKMYIEAGTDLGVDDYMLSFVEEKADVEEVASLNPEAKMILKIESLKGMDLISGDNFEVPSGGALMAARDDMMINIGKNKALMLTALSQIIKKDPNAIVASRIFSGIENEGNVSMGDLSDLRLMQVMGYKGFMLSDGICDKHFHSAIKAWEDFLAVDKFLGWSDCDE